MDVSAVVHASDDLLRQLGLEQAGDRLSLRAFCDRESETSGKSGEGKELNEKKRTLLESFLRKKSKRPKPAGDLLSKKAVEKSRKVQLGWKHFKGHAKGFVLVPLAKGGGTRTISMPTTSNRIDLIQEGKALFFPKGESIFGRVEDMSFSLANFRDEEIGLTIETGNREIAFNLRNYIEAYKAKTVRLYLRSKRNDDDCEPLYDDGAGDSDDDLIPMWETRELALIGSSSERAALKQSQDEEYEDSRRKDYAKRRDQEEALEKEMQSLRRKTDLREARMARVPPEPTECFVTVKVRHVTMGVKERRFPSSSLMSSVYDWTGSLCEEPENFTLRDALALPLHPSNPIEDRSMIYMVVSDKTPSLSSADSEIQFRGFGWSDNGNDDTMEDLFPVLEPNEESSQRALASGDTNTMGADNL